jgi:hypothetical protein
MYCDETTNATNIPFGTNIPLDNGNRSAKRRRKSLPDRHWRHSLKVGGSNGAFGAMATASLGKYLILRKIKKEQLLNRLFLILNAKRSSTIIQIYTLLLKMCLHFFYQMALCWKIRSNALC